MIYLNISYWRWSAPVVELAVAQKLMSIYYCFRIMTLRYSNDERYRMPFFEFSLYVKVGPSPLCVTGGIPREQSMETTTSKYKREVRPITTREEARTRSR
jgi:hypothetical protein